MLCATCLWHCKHLSFFNYNYEHALLHVLVMHICYCCCYCILVDLCALWQYAVRRRHYSSSSSSLCYCLLMLALLLCVVGVFWFLVTGTYISTIFQFNSCASTLHHQWQCELCLLATLNNSVTLPSK